MTKSQERDKEKKIAKKMTMKKKNTFELVQ